MAAAISDPSEYRLYHTMIRVLDLDKSLDFYTRILGMKVLRNTDYPDGRFTNVFVGYGDENTHPSLELTYNWDQEEPYDKGNGWGHIALMVPDVYAACERLEKEGVKILRPAGPMNAGTRILAFVEDPNGYPVELVSPLEES